MSVSFHVASRLLRVESVLRDLYSITESKPSAGSKGHHEDPKTGEAVHSTGKRENKKFANNTTFTSSPSDALLHTDGSKEGVRAKTPKSAFVIHGKDVDDDPQKKWFPVSPMRGWASAAGSLRQAYAHPKSLRKQVADKVKATTFQGAEGKSIQAGDIKPTGALHNERPQCGEGSKGQAHPFKGHDPDEHYRLCKGVHGSGGAPEHKTTFHSKNPEHAQAKGWAKRSHLDATGIAGIDSARHKKTTGNSSFVRNAETGKMDFEKSMPSRVHRHQFGVGTGTDPEKPLHGATFAGHKAISKMIDTSRRSKFRFTKDDGPMPGRV